MSDIAAPAGPPGGPWTPPPDRTVVAHDLTPSRPVYDGKLSELYAVYLRHLVLMVVTLGWSRFWGRTRLRRYMWAHFSILGDRFEYRGRGLELFLGFVIVLVFVLVWGGLVWAIWKFAFDEFFPGGMGVLDVYTFSVAFIGIPLAFVGQYTGLRYRLSRTRWRGIRLGLVGSAWRYGFLAMFLNFANAITGNLLQPVVSIQLSRPRIANVVVGSQQLEFAGRAGDIYGRYIGYYFLNMLAWGIAIAIAAGVIFGFAKDELGSFEDLMLLFSQPGLRTILLGLAVAFGFYLLFSLIVLPLRCWWQAYLLRYLVSRTRGGTVLFASSLTTGHMWGFRVLNDLIVILTLGIGWPWVLHRTLRLIANETWVYGAPDGATLLQSDKLGPRVGEGLLDMFDVSGI
jgi:uncharacterized membrane protein YjgN (DUF898 family)